MNFDFLGFRFETAAHSHGPALREVLERDSEDLCDYSVGSLLAWAMPHGHAFAWPQEGSLLVAARIGQEAPCLLQPLGAFTEGLQEALLREASKNERPFFIQSVGIGFLRKHDSFARHFQVEEQRDLANYVYSAADLAGLKGRKYAAKRNQIAQAQRDYSWSLEILRPDHAVECLAVVEDIASRRSSAPGLSLEQETSALAQALKNLEPWGLEGLVIRVSGQVAAFSIFDRLRGDTAVVLFERTRREFKGLHQVINRETARELLRRGFTWINREEDLGDPGLRKAKLSYHPARMELVHTLTRRRDTT